MSRYLKPIRNLGSAALIALVIGLLFPSLSQAIFDEETRGGVLLQSIPFVAFFVAVLLTFILIIVLVATRFNGKIPNRAYRPIELTIIAGILGGIFALFQPFAFSPYKYGFVILLGATLSFILWSHVVPKHAKADADLPPISSLAQIIAAIAAVAVIILLVTSAINANTPQPPFGERQRVWNSYTPERQAEIATQKLTEFNTVEIPVLVIMNILPALLIFFAVRELIAAFTAPKAAPIKAKLARETG
ncbi:MAG: hypothetical protein SF123_22845 [Chloroflexota bacterium]|nr:hypothetical protein [Chloroflexota bacterium]